MEDEVGPNLKVTEAAVADAYIKGCEARNNLTTLRYDSHNRHTHIAKTCCICDSFIKHGDERWIHVEKFRNRIITEMLGKEHQSSQLYGQCEEVFSRLVESYTQQFFPLFEVPGGDADCDIAYLNRMVLSPRSYGRYSGKKKELGCCSVCHRWIKRALLKNSPVEEPPDLAIVSGLMVGSPPKVLTDLNEVELSLISLARPVGHIFCFTGGSHKQIIGWHSVYANDPGHTNRVLNFFGGDDFQESEGQARTVGQPGEGENQSRPLPNSGGNVTRTFRDQWLSSDRIKDIAVILTGPFTPRQKELARKKTMVSLEKVKLALLWLKHNNILYKDVDVDDEIALPFVVDCSDEASSQNTNIETVFEMNATFVDQNEALSVNGGYGTTEEFKASTLDRINSENCDREYTLLHRSSSTRLKDYVGENLLKAFPLQFPYGVGYLRKDGTDRSGPSFYRHLLGLSRREFHVPAFVLTLHNVWERGRMVRQSFLRCNDDERIDIAQMTDSDLDHAVQNYLNNRRGNGVGDMFLRKLVATTGSMAHTKQAATNARRFMFAMNSKFGLPCILFTITPDDHMNFRIKIMADEFGTCCDPPANRCPDSVLKEFVVRSAETRVGYPGLCALDYENVLKITIEHFLGWDSSKPNEDKNIKGKGLFGDLDAWCVATEEQGRKTLHGHFLLWVKDWNKALSRLRDETNRDEVVTVMKEYATVVMRAKMGSRYAGDKCACGIDASNLSKCSDQDLRNLRTADIPSNLGGRNILKCLTCGDAFSSNDLLRNAVDRCLPVNQPVNETDGEALDRNSLWFRSSLRSGRKARMELFLMNEVARQMREGGSPPPIGSSRYARQDFVTTALRNTHDGDHCCGCYKKDDCECRMKIPSKECLQGDFLFDDRTTPWYCWSGGAMDRRLFFYEVERNHRDSYVNIHNECASIVFGCNTNVVSCVDGGSIMYITSYVSKNTQNDDRKAFVASAMKMTERLRKKREEMARARSAGSMDDADPDDEAKLSMGIKTIIGASLAATRSYKCSATMAAFLTRNGSRFMYSHAFSYLNIGDFRDHGGPKDHVVDSNVDGTLFLNSYVTNYMRRGTSLRDMCLYDAASKCYLKKQTDMEMRENVDRNPDGANPSRAKLKLRTKGHETIPVVTHNDFVNTKSFGGNNIFTCDLSRCEDSHIHAMEAYARTACLLFVPFRRVSDLMDENGQYLSTFRRVYREGRLSEYHQSILHNIQESYNSVNSGRPPDALERVTDRPILPRSAQGSSSDVDVDDEYMFENLISELDDINEARPCRNQEGILCVDTSVIRDAGANNCGSALLCRPAISNQVEDSDSIIIPSNSHGNLVNVAVPVTARNWTRTPSQKEASRRVLIRLHMECRVRHFEGDARVSTVVPSGTVVNMRSYAQSKGLDLDQEQAFVLIVSAFLLELHDHLSADVSSDGANSRVTRARAGECVRELQRLHRFDRRRGENFVGFLSGPGGTGKSKVINTVLLYCKQICELSGVPFNKRTIAVTALTGAAAVSIKGETTHSACVLNGTIQHEHIEEWKDTLLVVVDEISFASKETLKLLNRNLNRLKEKTHHPDSQYGAIPVLFAGDFSQLEPVKGRPVWLDRDNELWYDYVNTFMELRTNHRFREDPPWGDLLQRLRDRGCSPHDLHLINSRVVCDGNGISAADIPSDAVYATRTNKEKAAINDGLFLEHVRHTHSKPTAPVAPGPMTRARRSQGVPGHTICIKASHMKFKSHKKRLFVAAMSDTARDIVLATCGEGHVRDSNGRFYDPFLKLYKGRPLCITKNIDVPNCIANGAMCTFQGIVLKDDVSADSCVEKFFLDGYGVHCVEASSVAALVVEMTDGDPGRIVHLKTEDVRATVEYPWFWRGSIWKNVPRAKRRIKFVQFPVTVANARTVHKLQGRSIKNLVVSSWNHTGNWVYVVLSRCFTSVGLFLRKELKRTRPMSEECRSFHEEFRQTKKPRMFHH